MNTVSITIPTSTATIVASSIKTFNGLTVLNLVIKMARAYNHSSGYMGIGTIQGFTGVAYCNVYSSLNHHLLAYINPTDNELCLIGTDDASINEVLYIGLVGF